MKNKHLIIFLAILMTTFFACKQENGSTEIEALKQQLADAEKQNEQKMESKKPGLIHTVFFWLKEDITEEEQLKFIAGVKSLQSISHIQTSYTGEAAITEERGVVDNSYDMAWICQFEKPSDQEAYQIDPVHLKFIEDCGELWTKVIVYDSLID